MRNDPDLTQRQKVLCTFFSVMLIVLSVLLVDRVPLTGNEASLTASVSSGNGNIAAEW